MSICTDKTLANICYCSKEINTSALLTLWYPKHHHEDFHQCTPQATVGRHYFFFFFTSFYLNKFGAKFSFQVQHYEGVYIASGSHLCLYTLLRYFAGSSLM